MGVSFLSISPRRPPLKKLLPYLLGNQRGPLNTNEESKYMVNGCLQSETQACAGFFSVLCSKSTQGKRYNTWQRLFCNRANKNAVHFVDPEVSCRKVSRLFALSMDSRNFHFSVQTGLGRSEAEQASKKRVGEPSLQNSWAPQAGLNSN